MYNLAMEETSYGYDWKRNSETVPALTSAWRVSRRLAGSRMRLKHPLWVIDYTFNKAGLSRVGSPGRRWRPRPPRSAHLYPPETVYWEEYPRHADPVSHSAFVIFSGGDVGGLNELIDEGPGYARFLDPERTLGTLLEDIARVGRTEGERGIWQAQSLFFSLLNLLHCSEPAEGYDRRIIGSSPEPVASDFVQAADEYLSRHLAEKIGLPDLARHLHVSESTLSHRYQKETGQSPVRRLIRMRVNLAKALIVKGQPLKTVADATGFSDAFHLSKTFKQLEGISPREAKHPVSRG